MRCFNRFLSFVFGVVFFSLFFSFSFGVNDSFALDDVSFDLTTSQTEICSNWTSSYDSLCGYHYAILEVLSGDNVGVNCRLLLPDNVHSYTLSTLYSSFAVVVPHFSEGFTYSSVNCSVAGRGSVRMTLTDSYLPSAPSGSLSITENGTFDVTNYSEAIVEVPDTVIQGDYHDDLVSINHSILICGAVLLVLYFFYAIYRMLIKSTGGKQ